MQTYMINVTMFITLFFVFIIYLSLRLFIHFYFYAMFDISSYPHSSCVSLKKTDHNFNIFNCKFRAQEYAI